MDTMQSVVLITHTLIAVLIIVLVLLQRGKGADAGAAFGAGASGTVFGARGSSNFFSRATAILATVFFVSSLTLAYISSQRSAAGPESLLEEAPVLEEQSEPEASGTDGIDSVGEVPDIPEAGEATPETDEGEIPALAPEESMEDAGDQQ
jgi:preprotein translocase subunit SecG